MPNLTSRVAPKSESDQGWALKHLLFIENAALPCPQLHTDVFLHWKSATKNRPVDTGWPALKPFSVQEYVERIIRGPSENFPSACSVQITNTMSGNIELRNLRASPNVLGYQPNRVDGGDVVVDVGTAMTDQSQNSAVEEEVSPRREDSDNSSGTHGPRFLWYHPYL
jgi:hypothetical protein